MYIREYLWTRPLFDPYIGPYGSWELGLSDVLKKNFFLKFYTIPSVNQLKSVEKYEKSENVVARPEDGTLKKLLYEMLWILWWTSFSSVEFDKNKRLISLHPTEEDGIVYISKQNQLALSNQNLYRKIKVEINL